MARMGDLLHCDRLLIMFTDEIDHALIAPDLRGIDRLIKHLILRTPEFDKQLLPNPGRPSMFRRMTMKMLTRDSGLSPEFC